MQCLSVFIILVAFTLCLSDKTTLKGKKSEERKKVTVDDNSSKLRRIELPKEVIVVGAGISGLAAARKISSNRTRFTVTVYEAHKNRYGGRVWTDKLTNMKARGAEVDLGGYAFNVVVKNNPLLDLAEDFELKTAAIDNLQFLVPWEGKVYAGEEFLHITKQAAQIMNRALNESRLWKMEASVKEAVDRILSEKKDADHDSLGAHLVKCLPSYIISDYSTHNYQPERVDFGYEKILLDGMGELLDRLVSGSFDEAPLHLSLNKAVRQIKVDKEAKKVTVRFRDGSQTQSDVVIIAVPSSVLASDDLMFEPALPQHYRLALNEMSSSAGDKINVEFERAFWPADVGVFLRAVRKEDERGYLQSWINVQRFINLPVLSSFLTGDAAKKFEEQTDEEVQQAVLAVLAEMFGQENVKKGGKIVRLQRSRWLNDEWSKGGVTYPKVGSNPALWNTLSEPLCPYIYFVGEHTSFESHGTLHGAYNSGIRAGEQLLSGLCETRMREEEERRRKEERLKKKEAKKANKTMDGDEDEDTSVEDDDEEEEIMAETEGEIREYVNNEPEGEQVKDEL